MDETGRRLPTFFKVSNVSKRNLRGNKGIGVNDYAGFGRAAELVEQDKTGVQELLFNKTIIQEPSRQEESE